MSCTIWGGRTPFLVPVLLLAFSLACSLPGGGPAKLPKDGPPVPVSKRAAASFVIKVIAVGEQASAKQSVRFGITQEEVTSALAYSAELAAYSQGGPIFEEGLADFNTRGLPTEDLPPKAQRFRQLAQSLGAATDSGQKGEGILRDMRLQLEDPQVYFTGDGRMILRGYGRLWRWRQPLPVVIAPRAREGKLELEFVEGHLGGLPLPVFLFDPLGGLISRALLAKQEFVAITQLEVGEGMLAFSGELAKGQPRRRGIHRPPLDDPYREQESSPWTGLLDGDP